MPLERLSPSSERRLKKMDWSLKMQKDFTCKSPSIETLPLWHVSMFERENRKEKNVMDEWKFFAIFKLSQKHRYMIQSAWNLASCSSKKRKKNKSTGLILQLWSIVRVPHAKVLSTWDSKQPHWLVTSIYDICILKV